MKKSDFFFDLPPELIAQTPIEPRGHSRLLHLDRFSGSFPTIIFMTCLTF